MRHAIFNWRCGVWVTVLLAAWDARSQTSWTLTTADFNRSTVAVTSLDHGILSASDRNKPIEIPIEQVLRLDHEAPIPSSSQQHMFVFAASGDRLVGDLVGIKEDQVSWNSSMLGALKLPVDSVRAIGRPSAVLRALDEERKDDQLILTNHDIVKGVVGGIDDGKIQMQVNGDTSTVPLSSVDAILFASGPKKEKAKRAFRVRFVEGSSYTAQSVRLVGGKLIVQLLEGNREVDLGNVGSIEQINGPVRWLSDQALTVNEQAPFNSEVAFPARMDCNVFGQPLRVSSQTFEKGIGVHANSKLVFSLDGSYKTFRTRYAIDTTSDAGKADVNVRVLLDDKAVHEQQHVRAYLPMPLLNVDLNGAKTLTLEVTAAGPTDAQDRLDWIEAALIRAVNPTTKP